MGCQAAKDKDQQAPHPYDNPANARSRRGRPPPGKAPPRKGLVADGKKRGARPPMGASKQPVLAYYDGLWYGARISRDGKDDVDVIWDDGTYTKGLPRDQTSPFGIGAEVEGKWGLEWYPCTVLQLAPTVDVQWDDGTCTKDLPSTFLRPLSAGYDEGPETPINRGFFGRRTVLMAGSDVEIMDREGTWFPGIVHTVGDMCEVEYVPSGSRARVPLRAVRMPLEPLNHDLGY
ncbi:hypothetical protein DIPPA_10004 [Diplonema papillatum]|nr:hypothetical protein DIPPA_10004 [Diplonema papillatum]